MPVGPLLRFLDGLAQAFQRRDPLAGERKFWNDIPNLGSHILANVRRLSGDRTERCCTTPVLTETFVETPRYTGAVYKPSGWVHVGTTQGRGRYDRDKLYD